MVVGTLFGVLMALSKSWLYLLFIPAFAFVGWFRLRRQKQWVRGPEAGGGGHHGEASK